MKIYFPNREIPLYVQQVVERVSSWVTLADSLLTPVVR